MNAHEYLSADLEERRGGRALKAFRMLANLVLTAVGAGHDNVAEIDLVVRRRDSGREIMRTPATVGDAYILLDQVRRDLKEKSVAEFLAEWRLPEDLGRTGDADA